MFKNHDMNIVVGKNGYPVGEMIGNTFDVQDNRSTMINIFNSSGVLQCSIPLGEADKILDNVKQRATEAKEKNQGKSEKTKDAK